MNKIKKCYKCSATWCTPCNSFAPIFHKVSELEDFKEIDFQDIDVETDEGDDICQKYSIRGIPTTIFVDENENELGRVVGSVTEDKLISEIKKFDCDDK